MASRCISLLSLFLLLCSHTLSNGHCIPRHRDALLRLKSRFTDPFKLLSSWTPNGDCCLWDGVTCDNGTGGEVTGLDLSVHALSGTVDADALFSLTSLVSLNLFFNNLNFSEVSSRSPGGFEMLGRLTTLNLSYSGFAGQIPMGVASLANLVSLDVSTFSYLPRVELRNPNLRTLIRNLTRLKVLYLDGINLSSDAGDWCDSLSEFVPKLQKLSLVDCNLSGGSSLQKLRFLTVLRLDLNKFSSEVPTFVGNLSSLQVLSLSHTGLTGSLPEGISGLRNLTTLDASNNPLLGGHLPEWIGDLGSLEKLQLYGCSLSGSIPASFRRLKSMVRLDLSGNNLSGELPFFDATSSNLAEIVLAKNNLSGSIPSSYGGLPNLRVLDLQSNSLTGQIPHSLFNHPSLKTLSLGQNTLSGRLEEVVTYASSPLLQKIDLSGNNMQGPIPASMFKLSGLKSLSVANNNFSGVLHLDPLQGLLNLSSLDLSHNRLIVVEPIDYSSFPNISTLNLASCGIIQFPTFLKYQSKLSYLDLSSNKITCSIPRWLWSIGSLNYLNLSYNRLSGFEGPFPDLINSSLRVIYLQDNRLEGPILLPPAANSVVDYSNNNLSSIIPSNIHLYLKNTVFFSISNNRLSGTIPSSICNSSFLQVLDLSLNNLSGSIPPCLARMRELRVLNLRQNNMGGVMPSNLDIGCNLRTINLNKNQLEGALPASLSNCTMLEVLDVGNNHLGGEFPSWLGDLPVLRVLVLRSNKFSGPVKAQNILNGSFSILQIIDLSSNKFSGNLSSLHIESLKGMMHPDGKTSQSAMRFNFLGGLYYQDSVAVTSKGQEMTLVKILTIYTSIDISNNSFEGSIPDAVGMLTALKVLNMSQNSLTGPIPSTFEQLKQLESLDLSRNRLSGHIPNGLINLSFLSVLNLSYNNLSGEIPQGGQFGTFSNASYLGNPHLCGWPLLRCSYSTVDVVSHHAKGFKLELLLISILGFVYGFALVVGPLLLSRKWRRFYYYHVDKILSPVLPSSWRD